MKKIILLFFIVNYAFGQTVVNCDEFVKVINNNRVLIKKQNSIAVIDTTGKIIMPFKYEALYRLESENYNDLLLLTKDQSSSKTVLLNLEKGKRLLERFPHVNKVYIMANNYAIIETGIGSQNQKKYYINSEGEILFEFPKNEFNRFYNASNISDGFIKMGKYPKVTYGRNKEDELIYFDTEGNISLNKVFKIYTGDFSEGLAVNTVKKEGVNYFGFMNKKGEQIIDFKFSQLPTDFSDGVSRVKSLDKKYGFIDKLGNIIIEPKYIEATGFYKGYCLVKDESNKWYLIDKTGNIISTYPNISRFSLIGENSKKTKIISKFIDEGCIKVWNRSKNQIIDIEGNIIIGDGTLKTEDFKDGLTIGKKYDLTKRKYEYSILDKKGRVLMIAKQSVF